ncbi:MAG: CDGSH iron-sulfur domain-containing protein [Haloferacaceae archaeon]
MSREITHDATGPKLIDEDKLEEQGGSVHLCMCGLSNDYPYCDGSHTATVDEEEDTRYKYEDDDDENPRRVIAEMVFEED